MELYKEILAHALAQEGITVSIPSLDDETCFEKIEEIVRVFEQLGSTGDGRHDFG